MVIVLFNEITEGKNRFYLQPGFAEPNINGEWTHNKCNTEAFDEDRNVYAVAIKPNSFENIEKQFRTPDGAPTFVKAENIELLLSELLQDGAKAIISKPKKLIRKEKDTTVKSQDEEILISTKTRKPLRGN